MEKSNELSTVPEKAIKKKVYKISFSEYSSYIQCQHKWYLSYGLKFPSEENEELLFGGVMHRVIEELINKPFFRKPSFLEATFKSVLKSELKRIKDVAFLTRFNNSHWPYTMVRKGIDVIKKLDLFERFKEYDFVEVEHKLDGFTIVEYDDMIFVFKGYIDLILQHKITKKYLFIDWKTSRSPWDIKAKMKDNPDFFAQLGFYKFFYSKKMNIELKDIEVKFYNLPREAADAQGAFEGITNAAYVESLFDKLKNICNEIYTSTYMNLDKAKIVSKKNFCHRCAFNNETYCNDYDEFQVII